MPETRRIENYGILKLLPYERGAINLIVLCDVIQLPFSEYRNYKYNPPKGHYGYVSFMSGEYVIDVKEIEYRRQVLVDRDRYLIQLAWQEFCNSKTIAYAVDSPLPDTEVDYPIWMCDELRFKLEPGVIINVFKSHVSPVTCGSGGVIEPDYSPEAPGLPPTPQPAPSKDTPESNKLPLSSPYEGANDSGNTYVRGDSVPPFYQGTDGVGVYMVVQFDRPLSYAPDKTVYIQKVDNDPTRRSAYAAGSRCGTPRPGETQKPGISVNKDGADTGCVEDSVAIAVSMSFFVQT